MACSNTDDAEVKLSGKGNENVRLRDGRDESSMQSGVPVKEPVEVVSLATTWSVN